MNWRQIKNTLKYYFVFSPLGALLTPLYVNLDVLTAQVKECRATFEAREREGDVDPSQLAIWRSELEQMEWEQVRRLEQNGRPDDPFVLWKRGR